MSIFPEDFKILIAEMKREKEERGKRVAAGRKRPLRFHGRSGSGVRLELNSFLILELKSIAKQLNDLGKEKASLSSLINDALDYYIELLNGNGALDPDYSFDPDDYKKREQLIQERAIQILDFCHGADLPDTIPRLVTISIPKLRRWVKSGLGKNAEGIGDKAIDNILGKIKHPAKLRRGRPKKIES